MPTSAKPAEFDAVFAALRKVMAAQVASLVVQTDTAAEYSLVTKKPSPFPQHKGNPMWFGAVKRGKAYVSFHLMPLYMSPKLDGQVSAALKKRMQGKTCFNFKTVPEPELIVDLTRLTASAVGEWARFL